MKEEAAAYIRISDEHQSRHSLTRQMADVTNFYIKNNLELRKVFTDDGQSAFTFNRKEWIELEKYLKINKSIKYLIVPHLDRFSRSKLVTSLAKLDEIEERIKVKVLTISDPLDLDTEDIGVQMKRAMELLMSNYEWMCIRKRTTDGIYTALSQGRYVSKAPYGYENKRDANGKPIIVPDAHISPLVQQIFKDYISGLDLEEVRIKAINKGYKQRGRSAIRRILENPIYAGLIRVPKHNKEPERLVKGIHIGLVTEMDYWNVHRRLNTKKVVTQKHDEVFLRGILHCECGRVMTAGKSKGKLKRYWYYFCNNHRVNYNATKLHKTFFDILDHLSFSEDFANSLAENLKSDLEQKSKSKGGDIMRTKLELDKVRNKIKSVEEKYLLQPDLSAETYKKVISELKQEEGVLFNKLTDLNSSTETISTIINDIIPVLTNLKKMFSELPIDRQHLLLDLVSNKSLIYDNAGYRTPYLNPLFAHNELILKEKGLLKVEQSSINLGLSPVSAPSGT